jgi:RNA polymerase sigma-70 factor (ECF subfamily)
MHSPEENDRLLARLRAGDEDAVGQLADEYSAKIYQLAFRQLRNREDAEEVTQDVLLKVYRNAEMFRGDAALSSWIYRIAFNTTMSRLRSGAYRNSRRYQSDGVSVDADREHGAPGPPVADWSNMADERILRRELRRRALRAILALPAIYRAPVVLRDLQGMTTEEASAKLQVKDQTLKSRLHRGRLMLRKQLADFAGGLTLHRPAYGV